ncbi:MAG TPA: type II toxin-antitoxin system VapC family toxin [Acidimicrobiia bacterium]
MGVTVLDAGVVIAGLDADDAHHTAAAGALTAARDRGDSFVVPASAYAEVLVRPAARGNATVARVDAALDAMAITIADADREIARRAASLRARHSSLRLPDALVIATAIELAADHLLTTDRRWKALRRLGLGDRLTVVG